ncbi:DUF6493 family protein [Pseudonocardia sp. TRM90224]|uniref:DUF6493 family protein n=1 Tax=Pseudonocardia sp. TRM90224 TaxID=2812678 RepID=UPI001E3813BA|nr:DUF6493 family protein [Pseudonocardia sp. TRM90224]
MTEWNTLLRLLEAGRPAEVAAALRGLTPARRRELAEALVGYERKLRKGDTGSWVMRGRLAVAGAALLPAAAAAAWLLRNQPDEENARVVEVLRERAVPWLPDLAARLAERLPGRELRPGLFRLVVALVEESGCPAPTSDGFLLHLAAEGTPEWLLAERGRVALVLPMLDVDGVGARLSPWWRDAIVASVGDGLLDRPAVLDASIARLQRGGRPGEVTGFLALHDALAPSLDEVALRARDYVSLLADAHSPVAGRAQELLQRLDAAGALDTELFHETSRRLLARTEKRLVRAQLAWLAEVIARAPAHLDELLVVATTAFRHETADVQAVAVDLVREHVGRAAPAAREQVLREAAGLAPDLAAALGVDVPAAPVAPAAVFTPPGPVVPIETVDELQRELTAMLGRWIDNQDAIQLERVLAALVSFAHRDRPGLIAGLEPLFAKNAWMEPTPATWNDEVPGHPFSALAVVVRAAAVPATVLANPGRRSDWTAELHSIGDRPPSCSIIERLHEIAVGLSCSPRPALVSTPTSTSGLIDPDVLDERLRRAAAEGWQPWPSDLALARLRVPATDPVEIRLHHSQEAGQLLAAVPRIGPIGAVDTTARQHDAPWVTCWPALLPAHRDAIAGHLLPTLRLDTSERLGRGHPVLPLLAEAEGPIGEAMHLALCYGFGAAGPENRMYAVDAVLILAARDQLDGEALGGVLGRQVARREIILGRAVPALRDAALGGAAPQIWRLVAAALPTLLDPAAGHPVPGLADLIALAVELAQQVRPRHDVPGVAAVAAKRGSSRVVAEAKRLAAAMG